MASVRIAGFEIGHAVRSADGFAESGDAVVARNGDRLVLAIVDVLGHGPQAHTLAVRAQECLERSASNDAAELLAMLEQSLAGTIGAAAAVVTVNAQDGQGCFVGVGNTIARIVGRVERRFVSVDGIVGKGHHSPRPVEFLLGPGEVLILHTDGVSSRFARADYPQLPSEDVVVSAREIIRRFGTTYDDAACSVA